MYYKIYKLTQSQSYIPRLQINVYLLFKCKQNFYFIIVNPLPKYKQFLEGITTIYHSYIIHAENQIFNFAPHIDFQI